MPQLKLCYELGMETTGREAERKVVIARQDFGKPCQVGVLFYCSTVSNIIYFILFYFLSETTIHW